MKQGSTSAKIANSSVAYTVVPPSNFSYIEESICRCSLPLNRQSIPFLQHASVSFVLNISGKKFEPALVTYFEEKGVETKTILQEGEVPPTSPIADFEKWIASALEIILSKSCSNVVLIFGSADNFYDCLVIACMRRLQEWSFVSILAEFRHLTWPHKLFDFEQVIDHFHTSLVDIAAATPEFLALHDSFKEEEFKLLERCIANQNTCVMTTTTVAVEDSPSSDLEHNVTPGAPELKENSAESAESAVSTSVSPSAVSPPLPPTDADSEQGRIDGILKKLFFSPGNLVISEGTVYDASISLINEKDEED